MKITLDKTRNSATQRQFMELRAGKILCLLLASLALTVLFNSCEDSFALAIRYKIQYDANAEDATNVPENTEVLVGENLTEPDAPSRKDFTFEGWFTDSTLTKKFDFENTKITDNTILYAKWTQSKFHTVTVYPNYPEGSNGSGTEFSRRIATGGLFTELDSLQFTPPTPDKSFAGWYTHAVQELGEQFHPAQTPVTSDLKLYAIWSDEVTHTVVYMSKGKAVDRIQVEDGAKISAPTLSATASIPGSSVEGWYRDASFETKFNFDSELIEEPLTLYAKWEKNIYTISIYSDISGITIPTITKFYGEILNEDDIKIDTPDNYAFLGWYTDSSHKTPYTFDNTVNGNVEIYSKWHIKDMKYIALYTKKVPAKDDLANYDALCQEVFSFYKPGASVKTWYAKPDSSGEGTSWTEAGSLYDILPEFDRPLNSINADVAMATADDIRLVLVHDGNYNIGKGTNPESISMYNNVAIVGGWNGWARNGKSTLEQYGLNTVIQNGIAVAGALDRTALLYGFTAISTTKGQAFVRNKDDSPVFIDITFTGGYNTNFPNAVGMNNYDSNPLLKRVVFTNQSSVQGPGVAIVNVNSSPIIIGAVFSENVNVDSEIRAEEYFEYIFDPISGPDNIFASDVKYKLNHYGTAIKNEGNSRPILINATVRDNYSLENTIYNDNGSTMDIINTIVWGNKTASNKYVSDNVNIYNSIIEDRGDPNPMLGTENRMINNYFGTFLTNELQSGSPAINKGLWIRANKQYTDFYYSDNNSTWYSDPGLTASVTLPDGTIDITALDARGYARTDRPDIGAWEYGL